MIEQEEELKAKKAVQLAQKKLREGKAVKPAEAPVEAVVETKVHEDKPTEFVDIVARQAAAAKMSSTESLTETKETKKAAKKQLEVWDNYAMIIKASGDLDGENSLRRITKTFQNGRKFCSYHSKAFETYEKWGYVRTFT